jgi:hypothetical protein
MRTFLVVNRGVVVDIVQHDGDWSAELTEHPFDTIAEDDSNTFVVGEQYDIDLLLRRNREIWEFKGWISPSGGVPTEVTRLQARIALHQAGLLESVEQYMADPATPFEQKLAWQDALTFRRTSPTVIGLQQVLGLTDAQLDDLFTAASTIEV